LAIPNSGPENSKGVAKVSSSGAFRSAGPEHLSQELTPLRMFCLGR
jgi:hypothetical protein